MRKKERRYVSQTISFPPEMYDFIQDLVGKNQVKSASEYVQNAVSEFIKGPEKAKEEQEKFAKLVAKMVVDGLSTLNGGTK